MTSESASKKQRPIIDVKLCYICQDNAKNLCKNPTEGAFNNAINAATERQRYNDLTYSKFMERHECSTLTGHYL